MNAPTRCPACSAQSSRKSRWHSHEERVAHPGQHPFRCSACGHRFLAPYAGTVERRRWPLWVGLGAVLMIAGIVAGTVLVALDEDAAPTPQAASAIAPTLEAARAGDAEAQFRLGRSLLLEADSNRTKSEEAGVWLKRAQALSTNEAEGAEDAPETPSSAPSSTSISTPAADERARD